MVCEENRGFSRRCVRTKRSRGGQIRAAAFCRDGPSPRASPFGQIWPNGRLTTTKWLDHGLVTSKAIAWSSDLTSFFSVVWAVLSYLLGMRDGLSVGPPFVPACSSFRDPK